MRRANAKGPTLKLEFMNLYLLRVTPNHHHALAALRQAGVVIVTVHFA